MTHKETEQGFREIEHGEFVTLSDLKATDTYQQCRCCGEDAVQGGEGLMPKPVSELVLDRDVVI